MNKIYFVLLSLTAVLPSTAGKENVFAPPTISNCLRSLSPSQYRIDFSVNPYYLRGDFDGDGKPDVAVMVYSNQSTSVGLVICQGNGQTFVLGAGHLPPFSPRAGDRFLSSKWEVSTLAEFHKYLNKKEFLSAPKGEVITIIWEDGVGYIYWDGTRYRWLEESPAD